MAASHLHVFLESPGRWKICVAGHGMHPIRASLRLTDRIIHAIPHLAKVKDMKIQDMQDFLFSLQVKPRLPYTGTKGAISRPAHVADQSRMKVVDVQDETNANMYVQRPGVPT